MIAKTHIAFALSVASVGVLVVHKATELVLDSKMLILFLGAVAIGSLLPDIDEPNSRIGQKTLFVSHLIKKMFGHRGATHSFLFPLVVGAILYPLFVYLHLPLIVVFGLAIGCYLHIMGDMLTKSGCPFYMPIHSRNIGLLPKRLRFYTGGAIDKAVGQICTMIFVLCSTYFAGFDLSWIGNIQLESFLKML